MESEMNELIQAWKTCMDGTIRDQNIRQNAFNYIENFKQKSSNILDIGFYLAYQKESFELSHFGLQLITHTIKFKWNDFNDQMKSEIKNRLMSIIINLDDNQNIKGPSYLKNSMCLVIIELIKREWPQNWPNLMNELFEISNKSIEHKKLIFIILKYISEEFIDADSTQTLSIPTQRRKDINQYLNQYMESIFYFYLDNLEYCFDVINKNDSPNLNDIFDLTNTCLDSLCNYITWININLILSRNYSIINITLSLLSNQKLCINSAKCLISLSSRKGTADERKPLLGMFSDAVLSQLMNCIKISIENSSYSELLKYLVQILVAMGTQLNFLWSSSDFEKPANLAVYLNAAYEFLINENKLYSSESIQLWNILLQNEFIQADKDVQRYVILISQALTNTYILFKFSYSTMFESFDTEDEFNKFLQKYRTELSRLIRNAANLNLETYFMNSYEWTVKVISQTSSLNPSDESGFDPNSLLYMCWDALIFLWTSLNHSISKKYKQTDFSSIQPKQIELLQMALQFKSLNPNYMSFDYSFISSILNITCENSDLQTKELIVKTVFEKLYNDIILFKLETVKYLSNSAKTKSYLNLRRQLTAILLTVCKKYSKILFNSFEFIYKSLLEIINSTDTTQMEKGILVQALVHLSNESESNQLQLSLVNHFLIPIKDYFLSRKLELTNIDAFIQFLGLNDTNSQTGLENRKLIFYFVNCLYGFLKCIEFKKMQNNSDITSIFINIFESLIYLLKSFNQLHSIQSINKEYLDMTESCKNLILGMHQEKHGKNHISFSPTTDSTIDQSDKILMFMYNTYDTLNQLIGMYMTKFKQELLLVNLNNNQVYVDFMYKFGDALFTSFNQLPNFRIRYLIRYVLKSCLTSIHFDKDLIASNRNSFILKLNELLMEYFLPAILSKINEANKLFGNNKNQENFENLNKQLQDQIIEENQFTLMCRDLIDLIRCFFSFSQSVETKTEETLDEEQNEMLMENALAKEGPSQINELAIYLLQTNKIIYQSVILCLFDGLNWPDSYCCARLLRLAQTLIDKYPIVDQPSEQFVLYLNDQISERIFTYCLTGLQLHGEHQEIASLLITLVYSIYEKSPSSYRQMYNKVLNQIPNLNTKVFSEFLSKFDKVTSNTGEKVKKDLFKKIIQPVIGKNIGQLHKYDIQIRVLEPLNLNSKKFLTTDGTNGGETNICSLFDPNN
ncbi:unnamed protein product [Brachionus calyciflorus]|uniref:Exportin-5 n=1 Tax=Brachionus calyciflorus TaxID=104777 RepID=A0A813NB43_9BILA|nr:unnamed protein product [Brachionus calyciflorus]